MVHDLGPRARRIHAELRTLILKGDAPPGSRLPSHGQLAREFGVAVTTVRSALASLEEEGLITRQQGRGTFVSFPGRSAALELGHNMTEREETEEALRASEERFRATFEQAAVGMALVGTDDRYLLVNQRLCDMTGYSAEELQARTFRDLTHPEDLAADLEYDRRIRVGEIRSSAREKRYIRKDGSILWIALTVSMVRDAAGDPSYFIAVMVDITERKRAEEARVASELRYRSLVDTSPDGIALLDLRGRFLMANQQLVDLLGYDSPADLVGRDMTLFLPEGSRDTARRRLERKVRLDEGPVKKVEYMALRRDGTSVPIEVSSALILDGRGRPEAVTTTVRDITARKENERELWHQAFHDALTGLPNRMLLLDRLQQGVLAATREGTSIALLLLDLDRFKEVNDTLGHNVGDLLLREVGQRLAGVVRESDTVARLGGDEFAVLLTRADGETAAATAARVLASLAHPFVLRNRSFYLGASVGVAVYPDHGGDADTLLRCADVAMYAAKEQGRGYALYEATTDPHTGGRLALIADLRTAIDENHLVLHFQPKVNLETGRADQVEALVRWVHPDQGFVAPDLFIGLAEQTGLIKPLTLWVLEAALGQVSRWRDGGLDGRVAVNLSASNLHDPELVGIVGQLLARWRVDPASLQLEITESALMLDPMRASACPP